MQIRRITWLLLGLPALCPGHLSAQEQPPLTVPEGFVVEKVAGPPLIDWPMFASFDDRGRLYVAESAGAPEKNFHVDVQSLLEHPPHRIVLLEDTRGEGRFDKKQIFADRMTYPSGLVWHEGAIYCASPPSLWKLEDTKGAGVADRRTELLTGWRLTGISDELHGPSIGPDGRLYWGCGRFPYGVRRPGGPVLERGRAPLIFRCRTDGSDTEAVSGAQGNPVKLAFTPEGEPFACGTWGRDPWSSGARGGRQDLLIHCVEGGNYPMLDGDFYGEERPRTGNDLLPPISYLGVAAASGVTSYRSGAWGEEYRGNLFSALFNMHKVVRHILARDGSTFRSTDQDFLVSSHPDFHPTDVLEDADGSLLVVDTGGWYSHCPTSSLGKSRTPGGIYRIRRQGAKGAQDPWGLAVDWSTVGTKALALLLDDPRFAVRDRAISEFVHRGPAARPGLEEALSSGASVQIRQNAVWALTRMEGPGARAAVRRA
ncbi:MAG TPA: PVC-type heme-binding CxxCH protein, partial [Planctomycetota bacterium]|nr:PVC-type heme-binding CxxCH protein [Planctomycetota bacterium]